jgi:hypothetical protein
MRRRFSIVIRLAPLALLSAAALGAPTLTAAGGGCHGDNGSVYTEGSATVVRMDVCDFAPTVSRVPAVPRSGSSRTRSRTSSSAVA